MEKFGPRKGAGFANPEKLPKAFRGQGGTWELDTRHQLEASGEDLPPHVQHKSADSIV